MSRSARRAAPAVLAAVLGASAVVAVAAPAAIDQPATVARGAEPLSTLGDVVNVSDIGDLDPETEVAAVDAARAAGGAATISRGASIGMTRLLRGSSVVQSAPSGYRIPMVLTAMPPVGIANVSGRDVAALLTDDTIVMGQRTADLRGAQAGDEVELVAADGSAHVLTIAAVLPDAQVGGTEMLMNLDAAGRLGITRATSILLWGFSSRDAIDAALDSAGLTTRRETRVARSWDPPRPDSTISTARVKELLGEPAYAVTASGLNLHPGWVDANLPSGRVLLNAQIPIRARCHNEVLDDLRAALADVAAAGLGGAIDVANANRYGGCYVPRFNRISGELGFVSRHTWGMALDTNTVSNCQGCVPRMHCEVVRIFRRHNFAWGGNFTRPDGMHFEWVGEPRHQIATPTPYCPNNVSASLESTADATGDSRDQLFVYDDAGPHDH